MSNSIMESSVTKASMLIMLTSVENAKKYEKSFGKLKNAFSKTKV